jgi:hypothetical protein
MPICNNQISIIEQSDFDCIGQVAKHCDLPKLCIAIQEAQTFDLLPLLCSDFYSDVLDNFETVGYKDLFCGSTFLGCGNKKQIHFGLKRVLVYYSYSRYILINAYNDTANGLVQKQNDWSVPTPLKEIQNISDRYRNMAKDCFEMTLKYLCKNKATFTKFESASCKCDCGSCEDCQQKTKKHYGIRTFVIKKQL